MVEEEEEEEEEYEDEEGDEDEQHKRQPVVFSDGASEEDHIFEHLPPRLHQGGWRKSVRGGGEIRVQRAIYQLLISSDECLI